VADPEYDTCILVMLVATSKNCISLNKILSSCHNGANLRNRMEMQQRLTLETNSDEALSSDSESEHNEDTVAADNNNNVSGRQDNI
jgi:hypothetical protein